MLNSMDALNNLTTEDHSEIEDKIRRYFEETDMPEKEIEKRVGFAVDIERVFRDVFILMIVAELADELESKAESFSEQAYNGYIESMESNGFPVDSTGYGYIEQYARSRCKEIVDTAILHKADEYYGTLDHTIAIGEDESMAVANYFDQLQAIAENNKYKTWVTMQDSRVRHSHSLLNGKTIGIFQPFNVGSHLMMFPCDRSLGAPTKEIANCRCFLQYSK